MESGKVKKLLLFLMWKHWPKLPSLIFPYTFTLCAVSVTFIKVFSRHKRPWT